MYLHALALPALHCCKCFTCQIMQKYNTIHIQIFAQAHAHAHSGADMACLYLCVRVWDAPCGRAIDVEF